jgi:hypothetical protein
MSLVPIMTFNAVAELGSVDLVAQLFAPAEPALDAVQTMARPLAWFKRHQSYSLRPLDSARAAEVLENIPVGSHLAAAGAERAPEPWTHMVSRLSCTNTLRCGAHRW